MTKKILASLSVLLVALSFSFAKPKKAEKPTPMPKWVSVPASVFPSGEYMVAVGDGIDRGSAEVKAVQGIASVFKQSIKSEEKASTRMKQAKKDGVVATAQISNFDQNVLRSVDADDLIGIEVREFWRDEKNNKWYAVAVLEREKTASIYSDLIRANISAANRMIESIRDNSIDAYACCQFAVDVANMNENYYERLAIIKPDAASSLKNDMVSPKKLQLRLVEIANNIPVCVAIENDVDGQIAQAFANVFKNLGFKTTFDPGVRYMLAGTVNFSTSMTSDKKTIHCKYNMDCYFSDTETGKNIIPFALSGRDGHVNEEEAKRRAVKSIVKKIDAGFGEALTNYTSQFSE